MKKVLCNLCLGENKRCPKCFGKGNLFQCEGCNKEGRIGRMKNEKGVWVHICNACGRVQTD